MLGAITSAPVGRTGTRSRCSGSIVIDVVLLLRGYAVQIVGENDVLPGT